MLGKGGLGGIMKQAQKMQADMQKVKEEIDNLEITGQAGGGLVAITINGRNECRRVKIDQSLLDDEDDSDMLEDLVAAALNDATHKLEKVREEKMSGVTAGMNLPGGMKLPF